MQANVRSAKVTTGSDAIIAAARPPQVTAGDVLWAIQSSTHSLAGQPAPAGWSPVPTGLEDGLFLSTRIFRRTSSGSEPATTDFGQDPAGHGSVTLVAVSNASLSISARMAVLVPGEDQMVTSIPTPNVTPAASSHVEIRYVASFASGSTITLQAPTGYQLRDQGNVPAQIVAGVASRQISSSTGSGSKTFPASPNPGIAAHGITISIASADIEPEVPPIPPDAPGQGDALYLYRFSRLFGGELGDLAVGQVSFEKRISRRGQINSGNFTASFPIANEDDGDLAAKIVPRYQSDLLRGPGVTVVDIWRAGIHWGRYWIIGAKISKSRRQTPVLHLSGVTLEAFLQYVQLEDTLTPFVGVDRVEIARQLIDHMQLQPHADLGLILQTGAAGSLIDRTFGPFAGMYGQHVASTTEGVDGYEWMINSEFGAGGLEFHWNWGVPLGDPDATHTYSESPGGGEILDWGIEWTPLTRGTRWRARGDTIDTDASTVSTPLMSNAYDSPHLATGVWSRIDRIVDRPGVKDLDQLNAIAEQLAATSGGAPPVFSITVLLGEQPSIHPNNLGDPAQIVMTNEVYKRINGGAGLNEKRRILGIRVTPTGRENGRDEAELYIDDQAVE
ncbi:hypothetical protein ACFXJ8_11840 [Nonomuraea sp. NPDC059194]|uniref:hypothetical protein n=1 Tax=Nonomuraea sp. NPDC059194 TaxID=3346764 RepID=UPI00368F9A02